MLRSLVIVFALLPALLSDGEALAHQDGCHRWHSCPSDTGSYVCGDLGYRDQCPSEPVAQQPAGGSAPGFDPAAYLGQGDAYNCDSLASQAQAQAVLRADPSD